jgi:uncharacterized protein (DUF885 family)
MFAALTRSSTAAAARLLICALLTVAAARAAEPAPEMDAKLTAFFKQYLEQHFRQQPLAATELGDHRFDHLLGDVSPAARKEWAALDQKTLEELPRQVEYAQLSRGAQIDYEIFEHHLKAALWRVENLHPFEEDPRTYNGYISDSTYLVLAQSTLPAETNIAHCLARMEQIPAVVAVARQSLTNPPRVFVETAIRQNQGAIAFYEKDLFPLAGKTTQAAALKSGAARVAAVLKDYQKFLEQDLLPRSGGEFRLGKQKFYRKLELDLDAGMTADQVLADAQSEFDRVQRDMYVIARQLWSRYFPSAPLPPDDPAGRRSTTSQVLARIAQDHSKPEHFVADTRRTVARLKSFIQKQDILRLPNPDTCQIIEMPEFQRGNSTAYMNSPPPLDPKAHGYFAVSPPPKDWDAKRLNSYLEEYNHTMLQVLTIHEAYPGHYVQHAYANKTPSLIRHVLGSGAFIEGWAVYTEQTMLDQGYGDGDLALRLSQLKFYLRAVANALLDHQMHCASITDDQVLRFLTEDAYQSDGEARLKIIRAKQSSVQLSTYFVGRMAHYRLRQSLERELGKAFELGRYHEAVLAHGPVPVKYLPELVRERLGRPR